MRTERDYKKDYKEFWKNIVEKKGKLSKDAIMRELSDYSFMMEEVPKVYDHVSGGRISYPNTYAFEVISEFNNQIEDSYNEGFKEGKKEAEDEFNDR